ncbi:MAG: site-specific integrase [Actinobacteria bacterium]|nr:site-specific integrase [Actinomycetota bacterium]
MTGALQHISGDRWRVVVYAGLADGKQRQRSKSFRAATKQEARRKADAVAAGLRGAVEEERVAAGTIAHLVQQWLDDNELTKSPTTMKGYRICARRIVAEFGKMRVDQLTSQDVRSWYTRLAKGDPKKGVAPMTAATIDHHHAVLRAILRQAVADDMVAKPATFGVKRPKPEQRELRLPKDTDMLGLLAGTEGDLRIAVRIAAATGMRRGELVALRWSDIQRREVHCARAHIESGDGVLAKSTKGKRERRISLDHWTMRLLVVHRRLQVDQAAQLGVDLPLRRDRFILANMADDPTGQTAYTPSWLSHGWRRARGGAPVRLHDIRHWYATKVLESGEASIAELSEWLGHAQVSTTVNIYTHTDRDRRRVSAQVMGRVLAG